VKQTCRSAREISNKGLGNVLVPCDNPTELSLTIHTQKARARGEGRKKDGYQPILVEVSGTEPETFGDGLFSRVDNGREERLW
jgi:hypothetical protein